MFNFYPRLPQMLCVLVAYVKSETRQSWKHYSIYGSSTQKIVVVLWKLYLKHCSTSAKGGACTHCIDQSGVDVCTILLWSDAVATIFLLLFFCAATICRWCLFKEVQYAAYINSTLDGSLVILCLKHVIKCINRTLWNPQATKLIFTWDNFFQWKCSQTIHLQFCRLDGGKALECG